MYSQPNGEQQLRESLAIMMQLTECLYVALSIVGDLYVSASNEMPVFVYLTGVHRMHHDDLSPCHPECDCLSVCLPVSVCVSVSVSVCLSTAS